MIAMLKNYCLLISGTAIIASLVMPLISDKNIKSTLRFAVGIVICFMLVSPIASLNGISVPEINFDAAADEAASPEYAQTLRKQVDSVFEERVRQGIIEILNEYKEEKSENTKVFTENGIVVKVMLDKSCLKHKHEIASRLYLKPDIFIEMTEGE